ncbi:MAG: sigma-70 family RNA polymerase sigma factor [Myxococcales bacterium]|nr:sigma-70 family RNA polymerase sigma factor [Myxococcales bacterium]
MTPEAVMRELEGLRALARSLVQGDDEADDLIQETAIAAVAHPPDTQRPVRPWLVTVLKNRWRMNRRAEARRRAREDAAAVPGDEEAREDPVDRARVLERLSSALVALDEPFRTTVIRRYLDGLSAADIARDDGIPAATVRSRLKTGLDRLRAALDTATPRWKRVLVPFAAAGTGALFVKGKTTFAILIALVLAIGAGTVIYLRRDAAPGAPATPAVAPGSGSAARPAALPAPGRPVALPPPIDGAMPGQARAIVETVDAAGGVLGGRVINWSTGAGVAGAELTFSGTSGAMTIRSSETGAFELAPAAPGAFELATAVAPGFLPYAPELAHSPVRAVLAKGRAVRGLTVFLFPAVDYHGTVVDAAGAPVPGAKVRLVASPAGEQALEKLPTEWIADQAGAFVFHAPDDAVLEATLGKRRGWARLDGDAALTHALVIPIGDAPAREATIRGIAVDESGAPLADVLVRAEPDDAPGTAPEVPRSNAFATSGPDGTFVLEGLDRGEHRLVGELDGHAMGLQRGVKGGATGVSLVIPTGAPLEGLVATASGDPVPAFTLLVMKREGAVRHVVEADSIVDPAGRFRVHVRPGDYELIATAAGLAPSAPTDVTVGRTGAKDTKLVVTAGALLRGKVVSAEGGGPIPYARIMREARGGGASALPANAGTVTREDGTFELTGIPPGPVSITIGAGNHHPKIEAGMTAVDGGELGPIVIPLAKIKEGEKPTLELVGIGTKLAADGDALRVDGVFPGSGAEAAGIVVGDRLIAVDGLPVTQLGLDGAVSKIRGTVGTTVAVTVRRGEKAVTLVVERKKLKA